jgi:hypothetical protein
MSIDTGPDKGAGKALLDIISFGIDTFGSKETHKLAPNNPKVGGKPVDTNPKYNNAPAVKNDAGQPAVSTSRSQNAPNADNPTVASAPANMKLPDALAKVDPKSVAASLKNMMSLLNLVKSIINSASSHSQTKSVTKGFSGALSILANKYGYDKVILAFDIALENNGINQIEPDYQTIVKEGISNLIQQVMVFGEDKIPAPVIPPIVYGTVLPPANLIVYFAKVPNLYVQQYYSSTSDPYPGYIQWLGPNGDYLYSLRLSYQYPYASADEEILSTSQLEIAAAFDPYILNNKPIPIFITPTIINTVLDIASANVQKNGMEKNMGNGSSVNIMSLLSELMGIAGTTLNISQTLHLPNSVLNQSTVSDSLQKFATNISMAKLMQSKSVGAFNIPSALSSLTNIASLAGALGSLGISIPSLAAVAGLTDISSLGAVADITKLLASSSNALNQLNSLGISPSGLAYDAYTAAGATSASIALGLQHSNVSSDAIIVTESILNKVL